MDELMVGQKDNQIDTWIDRLIDINTDGAMYRQKRDRQKCKQLYSQTDSRQTIQDRQIRQTDQYTDRYLGDFNLSNLHPENLFD